MVQNYAHFEECSRPGSGGNYFSESDPVPRVEAACVFCAQKDWLEHRHKLSLFGSPPTDHVWEVAPDGQAVCVAAQHAESATRGGLVKHGDVYYLQCPDTVHEILKVERYAGKMAVDSSRGIACEHRAAPR